MTQHGRGQSTPQKKSIPIRGSLSAAIRSLVLMVNREPTASYRLKREFLCWRWTLMKMSI